MGDLISGIANLTVTATAPVILWLLRELRADVRDIRDNDLPHLYAELRRLREESNHGKP